MTRAGGVSRSPAARPIRTRSSTTLSAFEATTSRRRSSQSASAPNGMPSTSCGAIRAAVTTPTTNGEPVASSVIQLSASWVTIRANEADDALTQRAVKPGMVNAAGSTARPRMVTFASDLPLGASARRALRAAPPASHAGQGAVCAPRGEERGHTDGQHDTTLGARPSRPPRPRSQQGVSMRTLTALPPGTRMATLCRTVFIGGCNVASVSSGHGPGRGRLRRATCRGAAC